MVIKIKSISKHKLPEYITELSAGMDLTANLEHPLEIKPLERVLVGTGFFIELPPGFEAQIRPRSGLAVNKGITVLNSPGTIDADYRGEVKVILINLSDKVCVINDGERICQMVVAKHEKVKWEITGELNATDRGSGGFGHTGL